MNITKLNTTLATTKVNLTKVTEQLDKHIENDYAYYSFSEFSRICNQQQTYREKITVLTQQIVYAKEVQSNTNMRFYDTVDAYKKNKRVSEQYWLKWMVDKDNKNRKTCVIMYEDSGYSMAIHNVSLSVAYEN